jgi:CBS-domain-containing membrane protein
LRNSIVHIPSAGPETLIAEPSADVLDRYRRFVEYTKAPPRALDTIAVRDVYTVQWDSLVLVELRHMLARSFRLAPICDDSRLVGVFTETALCQFAVRAGGLPLNDRTTFAELRAECELNDTLDTVQRQAALAPESSRVDEIEQQFREHFQKDVALTVVLITTTGSVGEPILGIVTAHDLPSASGKSVIDLRT